MTLSCGEPVCRCRSFRHSARRYPDHKMGLSYIASCTPQQVAAKLRCNPVKRLNWFTDLFAMHRLPNFSIPPVFSVISSRWAGSGVATAMWQPSIDFAAVFSRWNFHRTCEFMYVGFFNEISFLVRVPQSRRQAPRIFFRLSRSACVFLSPICGRG